MKHLVLSLLLSIANLVIADTNLNTKNEDRIKIIYLKGKVKLNDGNNNFIQLKRHDEIFEGDEIITDADSFAVIRLIDNSIIKIEPSSILIIQSVAPVIEKKSFGITRTLLRKGRAFFEIVNQDKQEVLNVKTKTVSMAVRGTNFLVDTENEDVWVGVQEGEVEVLDPQNKNKKEVILPGEGMKVEKGRKFTKPKRYQWLKNINFDNRNLEKLDSGFQKGRTSRIQEFKKKRENWKFNPKRYEKREKVWLERKKQFRKRNKEVFQKLNERARPFRSSQANGKKERDSKVKALIKNKRKNRKTGINRFKNNKNRQLPGKRNLPNRIRNLRERRKLKRQ